jgi:hypothetical protein
MCSIASLSIPSPDAAASAARFTRVRSGCENSNDVRQARDRLPGPRAARQKVMDRPRLAGNSAQRRLLVPSTRERQPANNFLNRVNATPVSPNWGIAQLTMLLSLLLPRVTLVGQRSPLWLTVSVAVLQFYVPAVLTYSTHSDRYRLNCLVTASIVAETVLLLLLIWWTATC